MSHAIRAVEMIAHEYHQRADVNPEDRPKEYLRIKVHECPTLDHIREGKVVALYLGVPNGSTPGPHVLAQIFIRRDLPTEEEKRFHLAHELGHILMGFRSRQPYQDFPQTYGTGDEEWCNDFADDVCAMLQYIYKNTSFQQGSEFPERGRISPEIEHEWRTKTFASELRRWPKN